MHFSYDAIGYESLTSRRARAGRRVQGETSDKQQETIDDLNSYLCSIIRKRNESMTGIIRTHIMMRYVSFVH